MSTTYDTALNDEILATTGLEAFVGGLHALNCLSTDYSDEAKQKGELVRVPLVGMMTAEDSTDMDKIDYEKSSGEIKSIEVILNRHAKATAELGDTSFNNYSQAKLESLAKQQGFACARKVVAYVMSLISNTNFATLTTNAGDKVSDLILRARTRMTKNMVGLEGRSLFLGADAFEGLAKDQNLVLANAAAYGGVEFVREGQVPRYLGFDVRESIEMPSEPMTGFAVHPAALAVATRAMIPSDPEGYLEHRVLTHAETGITLGYRRHYSARTGKQFVTFETVYGAAVGIKEGLVILPETE